jgi:hypothetical protein
MTSALQWWADHGRAAALDRLCTGRSIDRGFVAGLDADCTSTVDQGGGDVEAAKFAMHAGLYDAHGHHAATQLIPKPRGAR